MDFGYRNLDFVNGSFVALGETVDLAPSDRFFVVSFPSYGCFRRAKKVSPLPTVGAPSASNRPSALSANALQAHALRGLDKPENQSIWKGILIGLIGYFVIHRIN